MSPSSWIILFILCHACVLDNPFTNPSFQELAFWELGLVTESWHKITSWSTHLVLNNMTMEFEGFLVRFCVTYILATEQYNSANQWMSVWIHHLQGSVLSYKIIFLIHISILMCWYLTPSLHTHSWLTWLCINSSALLKPSTQCQQVIHVNKV